MKKLSQKNKKKIQDVFSDPKRKVLSLHEKVFSSQEFKAMKADFLKYQIKFTALLTMIIVFLVFLWILPYASVADVAVFYPSKCNGGWENPSNATGQPSLSIEDSSAQDFTKDNSAFMKGNGPLNCSDFQGEVLEGSVPNKITLKFLWSVDNNSIKHNNPESLEIENGNIIPETPTEETPAIETPAPETSQSFLNNFIFKKVFAEEPIIPQVEEPAEVIEPIEPAEEIPVPEENPIIEPLEEKISIPEEIFIENELQESLPPAENSEEIIEPIEETLTPVDENNTPTEEQKEEQVEIEPEGFLEVFYTLDEEDNWNSLGIVTINNWENISFDIPITEWDDISKLRISLKPIQNIDTSPAVYLDALSLSVEPNILPELLDPPTILLKDSSSVISGKEDFNSNESAVFVITSPNLDINAVKELVKENKAEVLEDKEGKLGERVIKENTSDAGIDKVLDYIDKAVDINEILNISEPVIQPTIEPVVVPILDNPEQVPPIIDEENENLEIEKIVEPEPIVSFRKIIKNIFSSPEVARADSLLDAPIDNSGISAIVLDNLYNPVDINISVNSVNVDGILQQQVRIEKPEREFRPGKYTLQVTLNTPQAIIVSEQDFTWGVLVVNTDKSIYAPGNNAYIQMGVLNDEGHTICVADLDMEISSPSEIKYNFSTSDGSIVRDSECGPDNVVLNGIPDYHTNFSNTNESGEYKIKLTANTENGIKTIYDKFQVDSSVLFDVRRVSASRIQPTANYPVTLYITAKNNFSGKIIEKVPISFGILPPQNSIPYDTVEEIGGEKIITWNLNLVAGEEKILGYHYDAPNISPELFLLGPLTFEENDAEIFQEIRKWQIASDATCTGSTTGNWNTGSNWTGCSGAGGIPAAGDNITINSGVTITMDVNSPVLGTITIDGTLNTSDGTSRALSGTTLTIGATGTLTANNSLIVLSGTSTTILTLTAGGTFTAGTSGVRLTGAGNNTINSGAFTGTNKLFNFRISTSGYTQTLGADIEIGGPLRVALGTFDTSSSGNYALTAGTISIDASASAILTANNSTITLNATSGTLFTLGASGTFTAGGSTVIFNPDAAVTLTSGAITFKNVTFSPTLTTDRTYTIGSGALIINGNFLVNPSGSANRLTANMGANITVAATGTTTVQSTGGSATSTLSAGGYTLSTGFLDIETAGTFTMATASSALTLTGTTGTLMTLGGTGVFTCGTSTVTLSGVGNVIINSGNFTGTNTLYALAAINDSGYTKTLGGNLSLDASQTLTITAGTLDTSSSGNYALTAGLISIADNANAILTANASTITLNATIGTLLTLGASGTFTAGTSTVVFSSDGAPLLTSGTITFNNLTFSPTITTDRTWSLGNSPTINGNFLINPTAGSAALLTINLSSGVTVATTKTTTVQGSSSATSILNTGGNDFSTGFLDIESGGTFSASSSAVSLSLTGTTGTLMTLGGSGVFNCATSTVSITGAGSNTINSGAFTGTNKLYRLTINASGYTKTLGADLELSSAGTLTVTAGTFDTSSSGNYALTTGKITIAASQVFNANGSTITLNGNGNPTGYLLTKLGTFNQGTSNVVVTSSSFYPYLLSNNTTFHLLTINSTATIINAGAVITTDNTAGNGITITQGVLNDTGNQIVAGTNATLTIGASGTLCLGGYYESSTASCDNGGTATWNSTTMPAGFTTLTLDPASTVIYLSNAAQTVSTTPTYGNLYLRPVLTAARIYTITGALNVAGNFDAKPLASAGAYALTVTQTGTWNVTGSFTVEGGGSSPAKTTFSTGSNYALNVSDMIIGDGTSATTFAANNSAIQVTGDWTNTGTFTAGGSTVTMNGGTTALVTGATDFYNLTITHSSAKEVDFATAGTPIFGVTGLFTATGSGSGNIILHSVNSGTKWQFNPTGTASADYVDVKDGGCEVTAIAINPTNFTNNGNNDSCWTGVTSPTITFSISDNTIEFGSLSASTARWADDSGGSATDVVAHTMTAATNATNGYIISYNGATLTSGAGDTITVASLTDDADGVQGSESFGLSIATNGNASITSGYAYTGTPDWKWIANTTTTIISETIATATETFSMHYLANIGGVTEAGAYTTTVTYIMTANY